MTLDTSSATVILIGGLIILMQSCRPRNGMRVVLAGVVIQVVSMLAFLVLWFYLLINGRKNTPAAAPQNIMNSITDGHVQTRLKWFKIGRSMLIGNQFLQLIVQGVTVATIAITLRSIYRVYQLHDGLVSSAFRNEILFHVFEGPMIIIAVLLLACVHPGWTFRTHEKLPPMTYNKAESVASSQE
jgi:hypothetical protein